MKRLIHPNLSRILALLVALSGCMFSQTQAGQSEDLTKGASAFPNVLAPYKAHIIAEPNLINAARINNLIQNGNLMLSLDDAMKLFEEGVALSRECQKQLEEAEGRVEILLKKADGKLAAEPFDPEREPET